MLAGVVIIQDTDGCGEIDPSQLPNPDGPVAQEHDDLGLANPMAKGFGAHACAGAIGADAENIPGYGIEDRPLSLSPLGHAWSYLGNHPLDLASIDLQSGIGQQVLAGSLITARQSSRAAHPASHTGGVAVHQSD